MKHNPSIQYRSKWNPREPLGQPGDGGKAGGGSKAWDEPEEQMEQDGQHGNWRKLQ